MSSPPGVLAECGSKPLAEGNTGSKSAALLAILDEVHRLSDVGWQVPRHRRPSRREFLRKYYAANRPVLLTGIVDGTKAMERWSLDYLAEACGDCTVEVMKGRDSRADYEIYSDSLRHEMAFAEFLDQVGKTEQSNDVYLVANNGLLDRRGFRTIWNELPSLPYLNGKTRAGRVFLWIGPRGCVTPLHHDLMNVLAIVIRGSKRFTLFPPLQSPWLYNHVGVYSAVDVERPDLRRFPLFSRARSVTIDVGDGEALFVPVGWWHHVRTLKTSIMISCTNFAFANEYHWNMSDESARV